MSTYDEVIEQNKRYLTQAQIASLANAAQQYSLENAGNRAGALASARQQYDTGYRGLQNMGLAGANGAQPTSGEVPRLKTEIQTPFDQYNQRLKDVERQRVASLSGNMVYQNQLAAAQAQAQAEAQRAQADAIKRAKAAAAALNKNGGIELSEDVEHNLSPLSPAQRQAVDAATAAQERGYKLTQQLKQQPAIEAANAAQQRGMARTARPQDIAAANAFANINPTIKQQNAAFEQATDASKKAYEDADRALKNLQLQQHYGGKVAEEQLQAAKRTRDEAKQQYETAEAKRTMDQLKKTDPDAYGAYVTLSNPYATQKQKAQASQTLGSRAADQTVAAMGYQKSMTDAEFEGHQKDVPNVRRILRVLDAERNAVNEGRQVDQKTIDEELAELKKLGYTEEEARKLLDSFENERGTRREYNYWQPAYSAIYAHQGEKPTGKVNDQETDATYRAINHLADTDREYKGWVAPGATQQITKQELSLGGIWTDYLTDDQRDAYNAIYEKEGLSAANKYLNDIQPILQMQRAEADQKFLEEMATDESFGKRFEAWLLARGANLVGSVPAMIEKLAVAGSNAVKGLASNDTAVLTRYSPDSTVSRLSNWADIVQSAQAQNILEKHDNSNWGKVLSFAYQTGTSMADSLIAMGLSGSLGEGATYALFFSSAGNQAYKDTIARGGTQEQAMGMAVLSGAAEAIFEEVSLEKLTQTLHFKGKPFTQVVKNALTQAGVEGSEEFFTSVANILSDVLVMRDKAEIKQAIDNGTLGQYLRDNVGMDALGGFISGLGFGAFSVAGAGVNAVVDYKNKKALGGAVRENTTKMQEIKNTAILLGGETAGTVQAVDKKATNANVGDMTVAVAQDLNALEEKGNDQKAATLQLIEGEQMDLQQAGDVLELLGAEELSKRGYDTSSAEAFQKSYNDRVATNDITNRTTLQQQSQRQAAAERVWANPEQGLALTNEDGRTVRPMPGNMTAVAKAEQERTGFKTRTTATNGKVTYAISGMEARQGMTNEQIYQEIQNGLTKEARQKAQRYEKLANALGLKMVIHDVMTGTNGFIDSDGNMHVVLSGRQTVLRVASHELTHHMKEHNATEYASLRDHLIKEVGQEKFDDLVKKKAKQYGLDLNTEKGKVEADDEVCAELCERMLSSEEAIERFAEKDTAAAKTLKDRLMKILNAIRAAVKDERFGKNSELIKDQETIETWIAGVAKAIENAEARAKTNEGVIGQVAGTTIADQEEMIDEIKKAKNIRDRTAAITAQKTAEAGGVNYSLDTDYMRLAEKQKSGTLTKEDESKLRKMVDDAAKAAGYTPVTRYHQTRELFNTFSTDNPVAGLYDSETPNGIFLKTNDHDIGIGGAIQMPLYLSGKNMLHFANREQANAWYSKNVPGYAELQSEMKKELNKFDKQLNDIEDKMFATSTTEGEYDALDKEWNQKLEAMKPVENEYRSKLRGLLNDYFLNGSSEYDGIELDYDGHRWVDGKRENVHTLIAFAPSQVKSADLVTRDNKGNIIPLSERFNTQKQDIRYDLDTDDLNENVQAFTHIDADAFKEGLEQLRNVTPGKGLFALKDISRFLDTIAPTQTFSEKELSARADRLTDIVENLKNELNEIKNEMDGKNTDTKAYQELQKKYNELQERIKKNETEIEKTKTANERLQKYQKDLDAWEKAKAKGEDVGAKPVDPRRELRDTLNKVFEKPHSQALKNYASGVEKMQQRVLDIGARAGVCDEKGRHFDSKKSAAIQNIGEGYSNRQTDVTVRVVDADAVRVTATDKETGKSLGTKDYTFRELKRAYGREVASTLWSQAFDASEKAGGKHVEIEREVNTQPYTIEDLQKAYPDDWQKLKAAADEFRSMYDEYIHSINQMLEQIYPYASKYAAVDKITEAIEKKQAKLDTHKEAEQNRIAELSKKLGAKEAEMAAKKRTDTKAYRDLWEQVENLKAQIQEAKDDLKEYEDSVNDELTVMGEEKTVLQNAEQEGDSLSRMHRLEYREDYFHHFQEMASGVQNLKAIFTNNTDISPAVVGASANTKPKSRFAGFFQQRTGANYTADALNGMLRYGQLAEYKLAFDPLTAYLRNAIEEVKKLDPNATNRDNLIRYLRQWTNAILGKSHDVDRAIVDSGFGMRSKVFKTLDWINSRVIQNTLLWNMRSALVQISNVTNAKGIVTNNLDWANGIRKWALAARGNEQMQAIMNQSTFLASRYMDNLQLTDSVMKNAKQFAGWMLGALDEVSAKATWWAAYTQYQRNPNAKVIRNASRSYDNAIDYADDVTRRTHAGRGVGELAPAMTSKMINLVAPFQVEVNNSYQLLKDNIKRGNYLGLLSTGVSVFLLNTLFEAIVGSTPLGFDFIRAIIDICFGIAGDDPDDDKDDYGAKKVAQRLAGEFVGGLPYANLIAGAIGDDNAKKIFGEDTDMTRYGHTQIGINALMNTVNGLSDIADAIVKGKNLITQTNFISDIDDLLNLTLPMGGKQLTRTAEGIKTVAQGYASKVNNKGEEQVQFATEQDLLHYLHAGLFGKWALTEASEYFGEERLLPKLFGAYEGPKSTAGTPVDAKEYKAALATGISGKDYFTLRYDLKKYTTQDGKRAEMMEQNLTPKQKAQLDALMIQAKNVETKVDGSVVYQKSSKGEWTVKADYSSREWLRASDLPGDRYEQAREAAKLGMQPQTFVDIYEKWNGMSGNKKQQAKEYLDGLHLPKKQYDYIWTQVFKYKAE